MVRYFLTACDVLGYVMVKFGTDLVTARMETTCNPYALRRCGLRFVGVYSAKQKVDRKTCRQNLMTC